MLRLLTYSTLYPNAAQPTFAVFVENRLRHLVASGEATSTVVAPVPWFPFTSRAFGRYGEYARAPRAETRHGLRVLHPRFVSLPAIGMNVAPGLLYRASLPVLRRLIAEGQGFDAIDAHYFYPDGVAAAWLGRALGLPVAVTCRGNDVVLFPTFSGPRRRILEAIAMVDGLITVSQGLKDRLIELGIDASRVVVLRNGVDLDNFRPEDRAQARAALGLAAPTIVSVGHLIPRKGCDLTLRALALLPGVRLALVGDGPERGRLAALAARLGVADRVRFVGHVAHDRLKTWFSAADVSMLASSSEGWANVLLESMACGTPVVATDIPGTREAVGPPESGLLVGRSPEAIAEGIRRVLARPPDRAATRAYAEQFDWGDTTRGQIALFRDMVARHAAKTRGGNR